MIDDKKLKEYRSKIIERMNSTDIIVSSIIAKSYFPNDPRGIPLNFISYVLYQQPLSFSSRVNMLKNIFKQVKKPNNKLIRKLNEMSEIRNNFAHCQSKIKFVDGAEYIFNPKDFAKPMDLEKQYKRFNELDNEVFPEIISIFEKLYGKKLKEIQV